MVHQVGGAPRCAVAGLRIRRKERGLGVRATFYQPEGARVGAALVEFLVVAEKELAPEFSHAVGEFRPTPAVVIGQEDATIWLAREESERSRASAAVLHQPPRRHSRADPRDASHPPTTPIRLSKADSVILVTIFNARPRVWEREMRRRAQRLT